MKITAYKDVGSTRRTNLFSHFIQHHHLVAAISEPEITALQFTSALANAPSGFSEKSAETKLRFTVPACGGLTLGGSPAGRRP